MLDELYVENFAIIGKIRLGLSPGLNALTGETGAGKSLVADAVALLIGGRANDGLIRSGFERCLVEGVFQRPFSLELTEKLAQLGLLPQEEDPLVLSRELVRGGRGSCRVNGRTVTVSQLRELGRLLVNIHGQMEHMLLLEEEKQLELLDSYGGGALLALKDRVAASYAQLQEQRRRLAAYQRDSAARGARMALLQEQIEELTAAELAVGEEERLREESRRLAHAEKLLELTQETQGFLTGAAGAQEALSAALAELRQAAALDTALAASLNRLEALYYEAEDLAHELGVSQGSLELNPYRLDEVETRLAAVGRLKKKYGGSVEKALAYLAAAQEELAALDELDYSGGKTTKALAAAEQEYDRAAQELTAARVEAAAKLGQAITQELHLLCMEQAAFRIDLPQNAPAAWGNEKALYMIRTNPGEEFRPVAKIASGGELSRIVLGMKVILAQLDAVPTLVFDEVDSGLGGRALAAVAQRLAYVGESTQAIVVTHAPAMAAAAERQLHISKQAVEGRTEIAVTALTGAARVDELARMIAGDQITETTRSQAREMLGRKNQAGEASQG